MKTVKKKIGAVLVILLLVLAPALSVQAQGGFLKGLGRFGKSYFKELSNTKTLMFLVWLAWVVNSATNHYSNYFEKYVVINPNPTNPQIMRVMGFFISLAMAFYVVAIILTGFYLLFVSGSARGRAKAKYALGKLVLGMFFVSISPYLLQLLFQFSGSLTQAILDQGDIDMVIGEFNGVLWGGYIGTASMIMPGVMNYFLPGAFTARTAGAFFKWGRHAGKMPWWITQPYRTWRPLHHANLPPLWQQKISKIFLRPKSRAFIGGFVKIPSVMAPVAMYPYFLILVLLVLTTGLLVGRYLTVMIWTILFPLSIFFTSFELTKDIGRVMMEQTLQWTLLQVFYAIAIVGLSIGLVLLPEGYKGYSVLYIAFHSIAVVAVLFFGPWYFSSLLQKLFPP